VAAEHPSIGVLPFNLRGVSYAKVARSSALSMASVCATAAFARNR
jgi:hypothetical protein